MDGICDVATAIDTLAHKHGITAAAEPVDTFVSAVTHLCSDVEVTLGHTERLFSLRQPCGADRVAWLTKCYSWEMPPGRSSLLKAKVKR